MGWGACRGQALSPTEKQSVAGLRAIGGVARVYSICVAKK